MDTLRTLSGIPATLKPFFQDVDFESLDSERHAATIIERTLSEGSVEEIRWLFTRYGMERIEDWIRRRGALRLPHDRCALWHILLGLTPTLKRTIWSHCYSSTQRFYDARLDGRCSSS